MPEGLRIRNGLEGRPSFRFLFDGKPVTAYAGESVAAALWAAGIRTLRHGPVDQGPRGMFCVIGLCQECVVEVEGRSVEACRLPASEGLVVSREP
jgi:predicted molibdopterin-dependent oxidoreductase YjgC